MKRLGLLGVLLLLGCGATETNVVGNYKGELTADSTGSTAGDNLKRGMVSSMSVELKEDHSFVFTMAVIPINGTWTLKGSTVECTPKGAFGVSGSAGKPFLFNVQNGALIPASSNDTSKDGLHIDGVKFVKQTT